MSPIAVFFRTLLKSSAIFLGAGVIFINPSLDWSAARPSATSLARFKPSWSQFRLAGTTAQPAPKDAAVDGLIGALKDSDAGVRRQAAHALGELGNARAVPALIDALKDADVEVRQKAMHALGELGDARAAAAIASALKDTDPRVRSHAAGALAEIGDKGAVDALIAAVKDSNVEVRRRAVHALGEIGDERALPALTAALKDEDAGVRRQAIQAIAEIGDGDDHHAWRINSRPIRIRTPTRIPTRARGRIHARDRSASRSGGERVCCIRLGSAVARRMSCARGRYCSIRAVAERSRVGVGSVVR